MTFHPPLGAAYRGEGSTEFVVWAPYAGEVHLFLTESGESRRMTPRADGYFAVTAPCEPGSRYQYVLDGEQQLPDPASKWQPDGVHGPSAVVDPQFPWRDAAWTGIALRDAVFYELHVGTYTPDATFDALIPHLTGLKELGVNFIEVMPIAQFPGSRNWGYDGVFPFAAQASYGGPDGFRRFVDACHAAGLAVALDVVYNHLGPEGNCTGAYGPYTTPAYRTPWGNAVNFSERSSDEVRRFFVESALWWVRDCHVDALRVDAVHAIVDPTAVPFTRQLCDAIHAEASRAGRTIHVIAESSLNDPRLLQPGAEGGIGFDAQWNDDWHHAVHVAVTGERDGYYADYVGAGDLAMAFADGFVYRGQYSAFRGRRHGAPLRDPSLRQRLVVFNQNHDHTGNRADGARLTRLVDETRVKTCMAALLLGPNTPLLFMGEEWGETAPFQYFVSHSDPELIEAVRRGRREEFASFEWAGEAPDPQSEETFLRSRVDHHLKREQRHAVLLAYTAALLRLRACYRDLLAGDIEVSIDHETGALAVHASANAGALVFAVNLTGGRATVDVSGKQGTWKLMFDSHHDPDRGAKPRPRVWRSPQQLKLEPWHARLFVKE